MKKRLFAVILCLCLAAGLLPLSAAAAPTYHLGMKKVYEPTTEYTYEGPYSGMGGPEGYTTYIQPVLPVGDGGMAVVTSDLKSADPSIAEVKYFDRDRHIWELTYIDASGSTSVIATVNGKAYELKIYPNGPTTGNVMLAYQVILPHSDYLTSLEFTGASMRLNEPVIWQFACNGTPVTNGLDYDHDKLSIVPQNIGGLSGVYEVTLLTDETVTIGYQHPSDSEASFVTIYSDGWHAPDVAFFLSEEANAQPLSGSVLWSAIPDSNENLDAHDQPHILLLGFSDKDEAAKVSVYRIDNDVKLPTRAFSGTPHGCGLLIELPDPGEGSYTINAVTSPTPISITIRGDGGAKPVEMTVIWLDGDGSELDRRTYAQGEAEPVTDKIPVKAEDADYSYTFVRWDDGRIDGSTKIYWPVFTRKSKIRPVLIGNIPKATYPPSVVETQHCLVTIDPKTPGKGDNVTITVVPDAGYQVDSVVVQDPDGREIALRKTGNGTYSFVQPDTKVSISAVCKATEPAPKQTFTDVGEDDWFRDAVYFCRDNGYFRGVDDTHFMPDGTMTRAMFVTVLYRMAGEPKVTGSNQFGDVVSGEWYTDAVIWAAEQGLVEGYDNGLFGATDSVTREQMVTLLWRFSGKAADESTDLSKFSDADRISDWAKDAFEWAIGIGLIRGKGSGVLDPGGTATRAEVAQIAMNYSIRVG